ncbi:MAG: polyprenyl synthetase family protein [Muribaculaceae bacterium]|nr:polyprenyl synthetase family protein [Muribaculaceae bacterium]MDE6135019.1 polyprenyl synthetase family protein [Muribaculaceae bacterium]
MTTLESINNTHRSDLALLNERISRQLDSDNTLMNNIVMSLLRTKGKQLRPLMLIMCARLFGPVTDKVLASAVAIELIHNASLIHDDVVDNSMTRRSQPTVNAVWDNHIAVLVGDFFTSSAMKEALSTGDIRIADALGRLGRSLSLGEIDQIYNAREHSLTEEIYYKIIDYKTASLFETSAEMGCLAAGVDDRRMEVLKEYARLFGRCFQLRDDVFDYFRSDKVGKPTGNDLREGKVSLPLLHALSRHEAPGREEILEMLRSDNLTDSEIAHIQAFARDNGGIEYAFEVMDNLRSRAMEALMELPDSEGRRELATLFDFIIARNF